MNPWVALNFYDGWSVYGIRAKENGRERCFVLASTKVETLHMDQKVSPEAFAEGTFLENGWRSSVLTQRLSGDMAIGEGNTFAEAMVDLFGSWNPDGGQAAIAAGPLELDAGD